MAEPYVPADLPIAIKNMAVDPIAKTITFDIAVRRRADSHLGAYTTWATAWGATLGSLTKTVTGTASSTTGDLDLHVVFS